VIFLGFAAPEALFRRSFNVGTNVISRSTCILDFDSIPVAKCSIDQGATTLAADVAGNREACLKSTKITNEL